MKSNLNRKEAVQLKFNKFSTRIPKNLIIHYIQSQVYFSHFYAYFDINDSVCLLSFIGLILSSKNQLEFCQLIY